MPDLSAPFIVEASFRLPGLGLLVVPALPAPSWLADYDLHTALTITLPTSEQHSEPIVGTVEEIAQADQLERRALLLDLGATILLPVGTYLQASKIHSDLL